MDEGADDVLETVLLVCVLELALVEVERVEVDEAVDECELVDAEVLLAEAVDEAVAGGAAPAVSP